MVTHAEYFQHFVNIDFDNCIVSLFFKSRFLNIESTFATKYFAFCT